MQTCKRFFSYYFNSLQSRNWGNGHPIIAIPADHFWMAEDITFGGQLLNSTTRVSRITSAALLFDLKRVIVRRLILLMGR